MGRIINIPVFIILLFSVSSFCTYSQSVDYKFRHLTTKNGLSSHYVRCIAKDSRGFMWFGTAGGLDRFDGYNIVAYHNNQYDSTSLSSNHVMTLSEDINGNLLVGTQFGGLNMFHFDTETFTRYQHNPNDSNSISNNRVNVIYRGSNEMIWVGTHNGLNLFDPSNETFKVFKQNPDTPISEKDQINEIYCDTAGILWIGTNDGLFQFSIDNHEFEAIDLIPSMKSRRNGDKAINTIIEDHNNVLWVGTDFLIFKILNGKQEWIGVQSERSKFPTNYLINDIINYSNNEINQLWVATHWGLNKYDYKSKQFSHIYSNSDITESISSNDINSLFPDDKGLLWIAGADGIDILNLSKNPFNQYIQQSGKFRCSVVTFYEDMEGNFWMGSPNAGLLKYDSDLNLIDRYAIMLPDGNFHTSYSVFEILEDSKQFMWIGMNRPFPGIYLFNREKESFIKAACDTSYDHQEPQSIQAIIEDHHGIVWYGTNSGLYWFGNNNNDTLLIRFADNEILSRAWINDLYLDLNNGLWVTSPEGLYWLPEENRKSMDFIKFDYDNKGDKSYQGMPNGVIRCSNGFFWLGTSEGLFQFNLISNEFYEIEKENDLIGNNKIFSILEDKHGYLWLNSRKGLIRFNPQAVENESPKLFDISDGLPYDGSTYSDPCLSSDGRIFLPGRGGKQNGFYYFHPDSISYNQNLPPIVITQLLVKNEKFNLWSDDISKNQVKLKYNQNFFSFEFAALDYISPEKNQYAYYLEGLEDDWIQCGNRRLANYTNVPAGNYVFRVKGSNNDGYWNEEGASLAIIILPPPWKTWWAYTLYGIALGALLLALRWYDLKRQRLKQNLELERVEKDKLGELDQMKSRFFANISHEFRTPLTLILGPLRNLEKDISSKKNMQDLNIIQRNALRLQQLINQLLSLSKLESGKMKLQAQEINIVQLVRGYTQSFESLAKQKGINLEFESETDEIMLWVDQDKMEKILYNLLSNAFKYTGDGGRIEVVVSSRQYAVGKIPEIRNNTAYRLPPTVNLPEKYIVISVTDTGSGISSDKLPHIFDRFYQADDTYKADGQGTGIGLALTKELVELHHGQIVGSSEKGVGSRFEVYLPLGEKKEEERREKREEKREIEIENELITYNLQPITDNIPDTDSDKPIILIVEDNSDLRTYIRGQLEDNYNIIEARDGEQGLARAIEHIPDLVLSDVMMPKMDGYELSKNLKTDECTSHIPVILLTARASMESKLEGLETGADDFITKPFDPAELRIRIHNLITQRENLKKKFQKEITSGDQPVHDEYSDESLISLDQKFLNRAKSIVEKYLSDETFDISVFSGEMNLSRTQLYRKLRALIYQSATEFIRTIRLNHAATLLKHKTGNISEIALEVGFSNPGYFAECFKKQFGQSPSEYGKG